MARQPEVFVRSLEPAEAQRLVKITRTARDRVRLRRAGIVLASVQGRSASEAAAMFAASPRYAREVIHAFNESGFAALDPKWSGGRPRRIGPAVRETVCRVAKTPPQRLGRPFTTWSLSKLVDYLAERKSIKLSTESVRTILRKAGISWQATKTWKASRDPDFAAKMARILDLYDHPPADRRDGRGDLRRRVRPVDPPASARQGLVPHRAWARLRATFNRTGGVPCWAAGVA
jgi:transposase